MQNRIVFSDITLIAFFMQLREWQNYFVLKVLLAGRVVD